MVSLLDIIGPVMVGPSSSHTAGACRIGLLARALLGAVPQRAHVELHGSFARTGHGHGTDRAIVGGLLGFAPHDERLREALALAPAVGLEVSFATVKLADVHPNTTRLTLVGGGREIRITGSSIGAGRIELVDIDGYRVGLTGALPALVVVAHDRPGVIATVSRLLADGGVNVASLRVSRRARGGDAIHVYEVDEPPPASLVERLAGESAVSIVRSLPRV